MREGGDKVKVKSIEITNIAGEEAPYAVNVVVFTTEEGRRYELNVNLSELPGKAVERMK